MSYKYPYDDDRDVTVGDLRLLHQRLQGFIMMTAAMVFIVFSAVAISAGMIALAFVAWICGTLIGLLVHATFSDGIVRRLVSRVKTLETEPVGDRRFGERTKDVRGDD